MAKTNNKSEGLFRACHRFARIAPRKARLVARLIQGMPVSDALNALRLTHKRAARMYEKVLQSAVANAAESDDFGGDPESLVVKSATADDGPRLKRFRAGPMMRVRPILRRMAHLTVVLAEQEE